MSFPFRKAWIRQPLSADERARQGAAVKAAVNSLGSADARVFLNTHHTGLAGRPLDLAVASDAGLEAVETAVCVEARRAPETA